MKEKKEFKINTNSCKNKERKDGQDENASESHSSTKLYLHHQDKRKSQNQYQTIHDLQQKLLRRDTKMEQLFNENKSRKGEISRLIKRDISVASNAKPEVDIEAYVKKKEEQIQVLKTRIYKYEEREERYQAKLKEMKWKLEEKGRWLGRVGGLLTKEQWTALKRMRLGEEGGEDEEGDGRCKDTGKGD